MTFLNESRSNKGLGFLTLQHHNTHPQVGDQGYGKDGRHGVTAARVFGRLLPERLGGGTVSDEDGFSGPYIVDPDSLGDLIGSFLWNHSTDAETSGSPFGPTGERGFPGWRWSWPVIKVRKGGKGGDVRNEVNAMGFDVFGDLARLTNPAPNAGHWNADVRAKRRGQLRGLLVDAVRNDRAGPQINPGPTSNYLDNVARAHGLNPEWVREVGGNVLDGVPLNEAIRDADEPIKPEHIPPAGEQGSSEWHECPEMQQNAWQPVKGGAIQDIDFAQKNLYYPFPGLKFPVGHTGLAMSGTYEWAQDETYYPTDPRLFAVNQESDPKLSSHVCDTTEDFEIDLVKKARLHSFLRVIDNGPFCPPVGDICSDMDQKTLAWNITLSGCEDAYGGWVYDGKKDIAAAVEYDGLNGPFFVGCKDDKHNLHHKENKLKVNGNIPVMARRTVVGDQEKDEEDKVINPLHIHLGAFFTDSQCKMDGPKHHKGMWPKGVQSPNYKTYAWLTYHHDEEKKDEPEHLGPHPFVCKPGEGEIGWHRWYAESYHNMHNPPDSPETTGSRSTELLNINPGPPVDNIPAFPVNAYSGTSPGKKRITGFSGGETERGSTTSSPQPKKYSTSTSTDTVHTIDNMSNENTNTVKCYYYSTNEQGCGTMLWRAQHYAAGSIDYRNWFGQSEKAIESEKEYTPSVARLEAFGHQDPQQHKGPHCPGWSYTSGSESDGTHKGRNQCKTSNGGVVFMPPQYGMENYAGLISDPTAESTASFIFAPKTKLSFGKPDVATGKLSTTEYGDTNGGFNIYVGTSGELKIDTADGTNAMYIKQSGTVVLTGAIDSVPSVAASDKVTAVEDVATGKATTIGSITPLTKPTNITKTIAWNGAGGAGTIATVPTDQGFLYTKDAGSGVLDLYFKNSSGEVKLN